MIPSLLQLPFRAGRFVSACAVVLLGGAVPVGLFAAPSNPDPPFEHLDANELVRRAAEHDEAARRASADYLHDEEITTERLDPEGRQISTQNKRRRHVALRKSLGASDALQGDSPAGAKAAADTARDPENFAAAVDLRKLASRFELRREPDGTADDGRPCYVVSFRPRAGVQSADSREEKVLHQLAGRFWLAKDDLSIAQSEGALTRAVSVAWVASVYRLSFDYHAQTLPGTNTTMPARFTLDLGVKAPFYHAHQRQTTTMSAFRRD